MVVLRNNLWMGNHVYRDADQIIKTDKPGTAVTIRLPNRFAIRSGKTLNVGALAEPSATVTLDAQRGVDFSFDSDELAHSIDRYRERYITPAAVQIANEIDKDGHLEYKKVYNWVGTAGTTPSSYATSVQLLSERAGWMAWPRDGSWCLSLDPTAYNKVAGGLTGLSFEHEIPKGALGRGKFAHLGEFMVAQSANVASHLVGTYAGTSVTEGAGANGDTTTDTDGWSSGASDLTLGDVITIADVYEVNPLTRASTGILRTFVVGAAISDTAGDMDIAHSPTITTSGAYQTVNSAPADGKTVTVKTGTTGANNPQNLAWHPDAFALVMAELPKPEGVWGQTVSEDGYSVRVIRDYDVSNDSHPCRLDVLYGWDTIRAELACRLSG